MCCKQPCLGRCDSLLETFLGVGGVDISSRVRVLFFFSFEGQYTSYTWSYATQLRGLQ